MPSVLYEGMLAPLAPFSITGALWYQGEQTLIVDSSTAECFPS